MLDTKAKLLQNDKRYEAWVFQPGQIPHIWPEMEPFVISALKHSRGELSPEDVYYFLCKGDLTAFVTARDDQLEVVLIAEIIRFARMNKANIVILSGKNCHEGQRFLPAFEEWALSHNAVEIMGFAPAEEGHLRLYRRLGFNVSYHVVTKDLRRKLQ